MKEVLRLPAYRRLLTAYSLNELAYAIATVSLAFLIYHRTGSAVGAMAFFLCAQFVPALIAPAVVARLDQLATKRVLPALYLLEGAAYLGLAAVSSSFSLASILVLVLLDGIVAQAARALARAATVAVTQPAGLLREANAVTNEAFSVCNMAGPVFGGIIAGASGASVALLVNSGLFALIALTLVTAVGLPAAVAERGPSAGRLRAALELARRRPAIRALLLVQAAGLVFFTISVPVEVVLVQKALHGGNTAYGALLSLWGGGAVAGSLLFARWRNVPPRVVMTLGAMALGVGFLVMGTAATLGVALVGAAVGGAGNGVEAVAQRTALQEQVTDEWMARVMSLNESVFQAIPGIGIVTGGVLTALTGPRAALIVGGIGALAVSGAIWAMLRPSVLEEPELPAADEPEPEPEPEPVHPIARP
jgi:MFS family permease